MGDIALDFDRSEFECKCGCGRNNISMDLVDRLQRLRNNFHRPIYINSGCRCIAHNTAQGGKLNSAHICEGKEGEAVDIKVNNGRDYFILLSLIFMFKLFNRVGMGKDFIHVDVSKSLPYPTIWTY